MIDSHGGTQSRIIAGRKTVVVGLVGVRVLVENGLDRGRQVEASASCLRIGAAPDNDLVLSDVAVSRHHLALRITPHGIQLEDLGSRNGTWVNGIRVSEAVVPDGAAVLLGDTVLRIDYRHTSLEIKPSEETTFHAMISRSPAMREIFTLVEKLARFDIPVAVSGETGTGKELIARALHDAGPRAAKSFQILDCASVVPELLASQLFGHEKGAFTGADQSRPGVFESAGGGTVFLDEIGEMGLPVQAHLLRVLETRQVCRLGSSRRVPIEFRLVSATHRDLKQLVEEGRFREDLLYRLTGIVIRLPSLRERPEDIPILLRRFFDECAQRNGTVAPAITPEAMELLLAHPWPGNIRELRRRSEALLVMASDAQVTGANVRAVIPEATSVSTPLPAPTPAPARGLAPVPTSAPGSHHLDEIEKQAILDAMQAAGWNQKVAARNLGIARSTLWHKLKRYGIGPRPPP